MCHVGGSAIAEGWKVVHLGQHIVNKDPLAGGGMRNFSPLDGDSSLEPTRKFSS